MKVNYDLLGQKYSYEQMDAQEIDKMCFILTNNKGDFLNLGINENSSKYQGLNFCNPLNLDMFKIINSITLNGVKADEVEYGGYYVKRNYSCELSQDLAKFSDDAQNDMKKMKQSSDRFYLGPKGGVVYEVSDYYGDITIDLDMKKLNDFDEWGRIYNVEEMDNGIVLVEFKKENKDNNLEYSLYLSIKAVNFSYNLLKDWVKKEYEYSKRRGSLSQRYIYRLMNINIQESKRIIFGYGLSKEDALSQIELIDLHQENLENFDKDILSHFVQNNNFKEPLTQDISVAYKLSTNAVYNFLNKDLNNNGVKESSFAGFPWFANVWARDELVGLRAFINNENESRFVKEKLFEYLNRIDSEKGTLSRIDEKGSLESIDGIFWLAKRFGDFIYTLDSKNNLDEIFTNKELSTIFDKFHTVFKKIIENFWDSENELVKVKYGDSWMDTIEVNLPLDIQVQFLGFIGLIVELGNMTNKDINDLEDFEKLLKGKIRNAYFREGFLYEEPFEDKISSNVFLAYYFSPDLFSSNEWEKIFDNSLKHLLTYWGSISTLSKKDKRFQFNYTGENNLSYHQGDVWFWISNVAAIVLSDLNNKKYRGVISKILRSSTSDILKYGCIGFASEISSFEKQEAHGCFAQLWSSSTYIEMIDKIFKKSTK